MAFQAWSEAASFFTQRWLDIGTLGDDVHPLGFSTRTSGSEGLEAKTECLDFGARDRHMMVADATFSCVCLPKYTICTVPSVSGVVASSRGKSHAWDLLYGVLVWLHVLVWEPVTVGCYLMPPRALEKGM